MEKNETWTVLPRILNIDSNTEKRGGSTSNLMSSIASTSKGQAVMEASMEESNGRKETENENRT